MATIRSSPTFQGLPVEIRNIIYDILIERPRRFKLVYWHGYEDDYNIFQPFLGNKEMYDPLSRLRGTCHQLNTEILSWAAARACRTHDPIIGLVDTRYPIRICWDYGAPRGGHGLSYTLCFFTWKPEDGVPFTAEFHAWLEEALEIASMFHSALMMT